MVDVPLACLDQERIFPIVPAMDLEQLDALANFLSPLDFSPREIPAIRALNTVERALP